MKYSSIVVISLLASSHVLAYTLPTLKTKLYLNDLFQKVLIIDEPDRLTEEQYAETNRLPLDKVKRLYAATGDFFCKGPQGKVRVGIASLVVKKDVAVTAAHLVYENLDCSKKADLNQCRFRVEVNGKIQELRVAEIIVAGQKCSQDQQPKKIAKCSLRKEVASSEFDGIKEGKDWMALCLDHPVEGVEPYRIDPDLSPLELNNQRVISVAKSLDFIRKGKFDWRDLANHPKHIGYCTVREIYDWGAFGADDCDGSHGSSGGAILKRVTDLNDSNKAPIFVGIRSQMGETEKEAEKAARKRIMTHVKHNTLKLNSVFIPVQGELLETLKELEKTR